MRLRAPSSSLGPYRPHAFPGGPFLSSGRAVKGGRARDDGDMAVMLDVDVLLILWLIFHVFNGRIKDLAMAFCQNLLRN